MSQDGTAAEALLHSPGHVFPAVPASSLLAKLAERAAAQLMHPGLSREQTSTSVRISLWHLARIHSQPDSWRAVARCSGIRGRLHQFEVDIFDGSGLIAGVEHTRAVVISRRVEALARRRLEKPSMLLQV